jgi:hypothetical protein
MSNDFYQRFNLYGKEHPGFFFRINNLLCQAIQLKRQSDFLESQRKHVEIRKDAQEFTEYQHPETVVHRDISNDRIFPLETVELHRFHRETGRDIDQPVHIHYGPNANEYARSFNALAFAIGFDIFFRSNAYQPESEAGQKLLFHEMTHVAQYIVELPPLY